MLFAKMRLTFKLFHSIVVENSGDHPHALVNREMFAAIPRTCDDAGALLSSGTRLLQD